MAFPGMVLFFFPVRPSRLQPPMLKTLPPRQEEQELVQLLVEMRTGPIAASVTAPPSQDRPASIRARCSTRSPRASPRNSGFEIGMFAGSIASFTVLGAPDLIVLTLTEFAAQAYRINRAGKLPLMVDADHGYGNALNVMRTVAGAGDLGRRRPDDRGHAAAARLRREEAHRHLAGGRRRQDEGRAGGARGQGADDHRPHQRRRITGLADGIARGRRTRRPASTRCSSPAA